MSKLRYHFTAQRHSDMGDIIALLETDSTLAPDERIRIDHIPFLAAPWTEMGTFAQLQRRFDRVTLLLQRSRLLSPPVEVA